MFKLFGMMLGPIDERFQDEIPVKFTSFMVTYLLKKGKKIEKSETISCIINEKSPRTKS